MSQSVSGTLELFNMLNTCYQKVNLLIIKNQASSADDIESFKIMLHARDELRTLINKIIENAYKASGEAVTKATDSLKKITQEVEDSADTLQKIADGVALVQKIVGAVSAVVKVIY
jgi:methyl-accepting chemotaxis protein